jgi:hypothetical protein
MIGLFSNNYDILKCGDGDIGLSLDNYGGKFTERREHVL